MYALDVNFIASVSEIIIVSTVPDSGGAPPAVETHSGW
jgi:hypothetical protein